MNISDNSSLLMEKNRWYFRMNSSRKLKMMCCTLGRWPSFRSRNRRITVNARIT